MFAAPHASRSALLANFIFRMLVPLRTKGRVPTAAITPSLEKIATITDLQATWAGGRAPGGSSLGVPAGNVKSPRGTTLPSLDIHIGVVRPSRVETHISP
jgi:hypothetical protein